MIGCIIEQAELLVRGRRQRVQIAVTRMLAQGVARDLQRLLVIAGFQK